MVYGDMHRQRRPRSHQSSKGLKPLEFCAAGTKLRDLPQQPVDLSLLGFKDLSHQPSEASLLLHDARRAEGWNAFKAFLTSIENVERSPEELAEVVVDNLCQRVELRRMVEGAAGHLQANCQQVFLPKAAEHINGTERRGQAQTDQRLQLSGQTLSGPGRRKPRHMSRGCPLAWSKDDVDSVAPPEVEQECQEQITANMLPRSRSSNRGRGSPSSQTYGSGQGGHNKRLTFVGRGLGLPSMGLNDGPIEELTAKLGAMNVDPVNSVAPSVDSQEKTSAEGAKKKFSGTQTKRTLIGATEGEATAIGANPANRDQDFPLLNPDSLGLWATQSPTLTAELSTGLPGEAISRSMVLEQNPLRPLSPPTTLHLGQSSPHVARGRPPLSRALSTPMLAAEGAVEYLDMCHRFGRGPAREGTAAAFEAAASEWNSNGVAHRILMTDSMTDATMLESAITSPVSSAAGSRPGTTGSSRLGAVAGSSRSAGRHGMPLSASSVRQAAGGSPHGDNLFGVVSRSRNFSQGSPTELGATLASSASQAHAAGSKPGRSSSAGRLCSGAHPCPAVALSAASGGSSAAGRGLPQ